MNNIQFKIGRGVEVHFQGKTTINAKIIRAIIAEIRPSIQE